MGLVLVVVAGIIAVGVWAGRRLRDLEYLFDPSQEGREQRAASHIRSRAIAFFGGGQPPI